MNIVILDGFTNNPGDLNWEELDKLGNCKIYDRTPPDQTLERIMDADIVLTNKTNLSKHILDQLPKLKYIGVLATGYNVIDLEATRQKDIVVTNIPAYSTPSVAQMVFAHILNFTQHVCQHSTGVKSGKWAESVDFCYWDFPLYELSGKVLGIIGGGKIGAATARIGKAFGMRVNMYTPRPSDKVKAEFNVVSLDTVISESDYLSLHCPLNDETYHLINAKRIEQMKPGSYLINTGRGDLINEQALADALNSDRIAGAGVDVLSTEPPAKDNPLLTAKNCWITPHIAWATKASRKRLIDIAVDNVKHFIDGNPINRVN
jgi:glycerate dehydrogenase